MPTGRTSRICSGPFAAAAARSAIVTAIEFNLFPLDEVYAGILWYPVDRAAEVLKVWRAWTDDLPDEMTSVGRILQFPPIPEIPEPVRGQSFVVVEAIWSGEPGEGERLLEPLRGLGPVMDTVTTIPVQELSRLHMDPEGPAPGTGDGGMLDDVDGHLIDLFVEHVVGTPILSAEIRHLGGAVARRSLQHGAVDVFEAPYIMYAVGHRADAGGPRGRRQRGCAAAPHARALGRRAHVHELRRDEAESVLALLEHELPPPPPDQGDRRPDRPDPVQPPDPAGLLGRGLPRRPNLSLGRRGSVPGVDADPIEIRVLGCLIEKQRTTPDQYPLSLNGLRLACNQATNREPVVDYDEATIRAAIDKLSRRGWVRLASGPGSRVAKYRHLLEDALGRVPSQIALLAVLMLRGPQTPGELKQRVERLYPYPSLDDVQKALDALAEAELVERLSRRPGQSQDRYVQLLGGGGGGGEEAPERSTSVESVESTQSPLEERVARLEEQVAELQRALEGR